MTTFSVSFKKIICFLLFISAITVFSKSSWACGFTPAGDWVCDAPVSSTPAGDLTFTQGDTGTDLTGTSPVPLYYPTSKVGNASTLAGLLDSMTGIFANFNPCVQSVLLGYLSDINALNVDLLEMSNFMLHISSIQSQIDTMPEVITCPNGTSVRNRADEKLCQSLTGNTLQEVMDSFGKDLGDGSTWDPENLAAEACGGLESSSPSSPSPTTTTGPTGSCEPADPDQIRIDLMTELENTEGREPCAYRDSRQLWTIGVGHLIKPSDPYNSSTCLSEAEIDALLKKDIDSHFTPAIAQMNEMGVNSDEFLRALAQVCFQLGPAWDKKLKTGYGKLVAGNYEDAAQWFESLTCNNCWNAPVKNGGTPKRVADFAAAIRALAVCVGK